MAQNEYSARLQSLQTRLGVESVQEFVDALNRGSDDPIPYATARRYHRDREPPPPYLARVARTFGVRLNWLLTGEEPALESEVAHEDRRDVVSRVRGAVPDLHNLHPVVTHALLRYSDEWGRAQGIAADTSGWLDEISRVWEEEVRRPLGKGHHPLDWPLFGEYAVLALQALTIALRIPTADQED